MMRHLKIPQWLWIGAALGLLNVLVANIYVSHFFRIVNGMFARLVNKRLKRRGQLVMDRFKSPQIE